MQTRRNRNGGGTQMKKFLSGNEALYAKYRDQYSMIDKRMEQMFESTIEELIKKKEEEDTKKDSNES